MVPAHFYDKMNQICKKIPFWTYSKLFLQLLTTCKSIKSPARNTRENKLIVRTVDNPKFFPYIVIR